MWILYAFGSAVFAGITSILAKIGIKDVNSNKNYSCTYHGYVTIKHYQMDKLV